MNVTVIYFSPTGSTKKILHEISKGMGIITPDVIDITLPEVRKNPLPSIYDSVIIIGVPVYANRIPKIAHFYLRKLKGNGQLTVLVAVYGNIDEGIALKQLNSIANNANLHVIAAASFIGEHSFSSNYLQIAVGRPDEKDLDEAKIFGEKIIKKLQRYENYDDIPKPEIKRSLSFIARFLKEDDVRIITKSPKVDINICKKCGICVKVCPMEAIDAETLEINDDKCIRCYACVKNCKANARKIIYQNVWLIKRFLLSRGKRRKNPRILI